MDSETFDKEVEPLTDKIRELYRSTDSSMLHALLDWAETVIESVECDLESNAYPAYTEPEHVCIDAIVSSLEPQGLEHIAEELVYLQSRPRAPQVERRIENGINKIVPLCPEGMKEVGSLEPSHSNPPYDVVGIKWADKIRRALAKERIFCQIFHERHEKEHPRGTGPGGSVRMGDNMLPGVWRVFVREDDDVLAGQVITICGGQLL